MCSEMRYIVKKTSDNFRCEINSYIMYDKEKGLSRKEEVVAGGVCRGKGAFCLYPTTPGPHIVTDRLLTD